MNTPKLPRRFAVFGIAIGFGLMVMWWYIGEYNPFHLPTSEQARTMGNYSAPSLYWLLKDLMFVLCPGLLIQVFTIGTSDRFAWIMWVLSALINGLIYYAVGLILAALIKRWGKVSDVKSG
jgi:hypothetical protein